MRHMPQSACATHVVEWNRGCSRRVLDELASEEPLEIRVARRPITITMRTPGDDFDLAAGWLLSEGLIARRDQIAAIAYGLRDDGEVTANVVEVTLADDASVDLARLDRHVVAGSACGVCGRTSIEAIRARDIERPNALFDLDPAVLARLPDSLRAAQRIFGRTGGLHAAGLFDPEGGLVAVREDIGRHNAVDKVVGAAVLDGSLPLSNRILMVSGRGGFEIVQKALVAGVPVLACVSAPSSLAVQLARTYRLTFVGFLRGDRFVVYAGEERLRQATESDAC
jgi:FdhD protein